MRDDYFYNLADLLEADLETLECNGPAVNTYFTKHRLLQVALQQHRLKAIENALEYFEIPENFSLKERLAMYELLKE